MGVQAVIQSEVSGGAYILPGDPSLPTSHSDVNHLSTPLGNILGQTLQT